MIPHNFKPQKPGRVVRPSTINQTHDDVRRLAISQPGPGWGGQGSPGSLVTFVNSISDQVAFTGLGAIPGRGSPSNPTLGRGTVQLVVPVVDDSGSGNTTIDTGTTFQVYNLSINEVANNTYVLVRRYGDAWIVIWEDCPTSSNA